MVTMTRIITSDMTAISTSNIVTVVDPPDGLGPGSIVLYS